MTSGTYSGATARTNVGPMANPNLMESLARAQAAETRYGPYPQPGRT